MCIAHGLMRRQDFELGGPNRKSQAMTSLEIFEKREFF